MSMIREKLSSIGAVLVLVGLLSSVLQLVGYELRVLRPLNEATPLVAWGIRLGLVALGVVLFFLGPSHQESSDSA